MTKELQADPPADDSGPAVSLTIVPTYVVGVLRADVLARHTPVPLVPYAKLGVGFALWSLDLRKVEDHPELETQGTGAAAKSPSAGYQGALGIMLYLDALDRSGDLVMESDFGINSSYVFFEWYNSNLDGFGSGNDLNVGTNTWVLGIALEV